MNQGSGRALRVLWGSEMSPAREQNQDSVRVYHEQKVVQMSGRGSMMALADGLGGYRGGAEAARMAVDQLWLYYQLPASSFHPRESLLGLFEKANRALHQMGQQSEQHRRMGSTLSTVLFDPTYRHFMVIQVGDSPVFQIRKGQVRVLSVAHVEEGTNRLTQRLGQKAPLSPHICTGNVEEGDRFVLASDGIWTVMSPQGWTQRMASAEPSDELLEFTMGKIREEGGDNGTLLLVDISSEEQAP